MKFDREAGAFADAEFGADTGDFGLRQFLSASLHQSVEDPVPESDAEERGEERCR